MTIRVRLIIGGIALLLSSSLLATEALPFQAMVQKYPLEKVTLPETLDLERSATLNKTGYVFYLLSPLSQEFIANGGVPKPTPNKRP